MRNLLFVVLLSSFVWSSIGYVSNFKGSADIVRSMNTLKVKNGTKIKVKDKIITQEKSRVKVILEDNTVVTIGANSTFVFDRYKFGTRDNSVADMHIERGFFRSVSGKIGKLAPEHFKVKTIMSTIGIRGTDFSAALADTFELYKCYKGKISVLHNGKTYIVAEGEQLRLEKESFSSVAPFKFYVGAGTIYNRTYSVDSGWFDDGIATQDETGGISLIAGYQFNDYLALETRITTTFYERNYADLTAYSMFLKPQYPVTDTFSVYGLLGFGKVKVEGSKGDSFPGAHTDMIGKTILDDTQFQWGIGVSYNVTDNFSIFADYTSLANDADIDSTLYSYDPAVYHKLSVDGVTVGLLYSF
ncbi:outer membrane beta-barrel protein [Sulfurovum sp. NBC37-1]|uniref:outer membrane beta-barrel protein n=1 Tax=Sulfurovum sp. (strain NBC37-1) TaxID=387093 RepID=UPI0001587B75|nr:outer membrane beta-barrel protein [Sulfurovum sp. NBC37-1]BAF72801.1 hypothetical protein SUN_1854 [Sulfurovum sp. NBC37-1]